MSGLIFVKKFLRDISIWEYLLFLFFFIFSAAIMLKTFAVDGNGNMQIASRAWSDFAATIPLIRSFSYGNNFPPEYPIFAGPPIRYHFVIFAIVGMLERVGVRIDWALNSLSILFFFSLLLAIYFFGKIIFKRKSVGLLAVLLFLFNGSLSFLEFFKKYPLRSATISNILENTEFSSFGPYDGKIVSAFWNLNIYTNQRHLSFAYAVFLLILLLIWRYNQKPKNLSYKKSAVLGVLVGLSPFFHLSVFIMTGISLLTFFIVLSQIRKKIFIIGAIALLFAIPQFLYMGKSQIPVNFYNPGYLVNPLTVSDFFTYWFYNFGLTIFIAPLGLFLANKIQRRFFLPFLAFFAVANLFQFTPDMPTNHKFINLFAIGLNFFTAFFIIKLWNKNIAGKTITPILLFLLMLSGFIDIFPIFNDYRLTLEDIPNNKTALFIKENTAKDAVFLNSSFLYHPASLAGRKIYVGWPYFSWGAGYDTNLRGENMQKMLNPDRLEDFCTLLTTEGIDYIEILEPAELIDITVDYKYFENNFIKIYSDTNLNQNIYKVSPPCIKYEN